MTLSKKCKCHPDTDQLEPIRSGPNVIKVNLELVKVHNIGWMILLAPHFGI